MNKLYPLLLFVFVTITVFGQAPLGMNYQAVVRGVSGQILPDSTSIKLRFTIHDITPTGTAVFTETQNAMTNHFGLVNIQIGSGNNLSLVNWGNGGKFLQVETDVNNSGSFADMGTTQLLSVPYALYAGNSATGPMGQAGANGLNGPTGPIGATGPPGLGGNTGATGATGATGIQGLSGVTGAKGDTGITGATGASAPDAWNLLGNTGTNATTNFLGTADLNDVVIKANNLERMRFQANGQVLVQCSPMAADVFEVSGNATLPTAIHAFTPDGTAILARSIGLNGIGLYAFAPNNMGAYISGYERGTESWASSKTGYGVSGNSTGSQGYGVYGHSPWVGVYGAGQTYGTYGAGTSSTATGVYGFSLGTGYGTYGMGTSIGVFGQCLDTGNCAGVYATTTNTGNGGFWVGIAYRSAGTDYKILGLGTMSTVVKGLDGKDVIFHAPETPEVYFEDYGFGQLENGKAHVELDAVFVKNVTINDKHPLRSFIQLEGNTDCNGVSVMNKTNSGFDVIELKEGKSSAPFQWHVVCNRADALSSSGLVTSRYADLRYEPAPPRKHNVEPPAKAEASKQIEYKP